MSTHSLYPEVEICSLWGTVCAVNVRGKSQGEEFLVLSVCVCVRACVWTLPGRARTISSFPAVWSPDSLDVCSTSDMTFSVRHF